MRRHLLYTLLLLGAFAGTAAAQQNPYTIGIAPGHDGTGDVAYDPVAKRLTAGVGSQLAITPNIYLGGSLGNPVIVGGKLQMALPVDNTGQFTGPATATDLVITGDVQGQDALKGTLLTGRVTQFSYYDNPTAGAADTANIYLAVTGGALQALYGGRSIYVQLIVEAPSFQAVAPDSLFNHAFTGRPKGKVQPATGCGGGIGDFVWHDKNRNGLQDDGGYVASGLDNVVVQLRDQNGTLLLNTTTMSGALKGLYGFADLCPATYQVHVTGAGIPANFTPTPINSGSPAVPDDSNTPVPFTVTLPTPGLGTPLQNPTIDFGYVSPCTGQVGDFVWIDGDRNGLQDAGEPGLGGVVVDLVDAGSNAVRQTVTTNNGGAPGKYLFTGVCPGSYYVRFTRPQGFDFTGPNVSGAVPQPFDSDAVTPVPSTDWWKSTSFFIADGQTDLTWDAGLVTRPASLGNRLWEDTNRDGAQTPGEPGVVGAAVELYTCSGTPVASTATGADGTYAFTNLQPGDYYVLFRNPDETRYMGFTRQYAAGLDPAAANDTDSNVYVAGSQVGETDCLTLDSGEHNPTLDAGLLVKPAGLGDRLWFDGNGNGVQDGGEPGVPGAGVSLYTCAGTFVASTMTGANGLYEFHDLTPGGYYIAFTNPDPALYRGFTAGNALGPDPTFANDFDSNADGTTGRTGCVTLMAGEYNPTIDAGLLPNTPVETCGVTLTKECAVVPAPATTAPFVCSDAKPIDALTMIWTGAQVVNVKAYKGAIGSMLLATIAGVKPGQEVTVSGYAGAPNDVVWEVFDAVTGVKIGASDFHISCSDIDMNGPEDCGKIQGDAKGLAGFLNLWKFEGMAGNGQVLDCTVAPADLTWRESCEVALGPSPGCATAGKPTSLTFKYDPKACKSNNNNPQGGKYLCSGTPAAGDVRVTSTTSGLTFSPQVVGPGQEFTVSGSFGSQTVFNLTPAGSATVAQSISIHTSCSQALDVGNTFDSFTLAGFNGERGGAQVKYRYIVTNTSSGALTYDLVDTVNGTIVNSYLRQVLEKDATQTFDNYLTTVTGPVTSTATVTGIVGAAPNQAVCQATDAVNITVPPAPPCALSTATPAPFTYAKQLRWSVTNGGRTAITLKNVIAVWPATNGYLSKVKLDGDNSWDGTINCAGGTCFANITSSMFVADANKKSIKAGDTRLFALDFQSNAATDLSKYSLVVDFGGGCVLSYNADPQTCVPGATLGDTVWFDANNNGIQDALGVVERGVGGVSLALKALNGMVLATTTTDALGHYTFSGPNVCAGAMYLVELTPPGGYGAAQSSAAGSTTANDSNPHPALVTVPVGGNDPTIDFGLIDGINYCPATPINGVTTVGTLWATPLAAGVPAPAGTPYEGRTFTTDVVVIRYDQSFSANDNTYGTGSAWGHTFGDLVGSDMAQIAIFNGSGAKTLEFKIDTISLSPSEPSGYGSLGVKGGEGGILLGDGGLVIDAMTAIDQNLNGYGYCSGGATGTCKSGPAPLLVNSGPAPNTTYPGREKFSLVNAFYAVVDATAFGPGGMTNAARQVVLVDQHNSPSKSGSFDPIVCK